MIKSYLPRCDERQAPHWAWADGIGRQDWGISVTVMLLAAILPRVACGAGAPAGTIVQNVVTVSYSIGTHSNLQITSAPASFMVAEIINVTLTSQDAGPVTVGSPDRNGALTFVLTNTGNATESFSLARNDSLSGDNYDPLIGSAGGIFLENGLQPGFQASGPNGDTLYVPGANDPVLGADASRLVYVVSDTPPSLGVGSIGKSMLTAVSTRHGAAGALPGTTFSGAGPSGSDLVVGNSRAQATQISSYVVGGVVVSINKTVLAVVDSTGGSTVSPGALLTYQIQVNVAGSGMAQNVMLNDPIPANTTYVANSLSVDGVPRTDAVDSDNADFSGGAVRANFGNTSAPTHHVVQFRVTVN